MRQDVEILHPSRDACVPHVGSSTSPSMPSPSMPSLHFESMIVLSRLATPCLGHELRSIGYLGWRRPSEVRRHGACLASKNKPLTQLSEDDSPGPPGILGFGFGEKELMALQRHFEGAEIRIRSGDSVCRKGATVADALALLTLDEGTASESCAEAFECFSRVVLFCGLPGEVIEGLIEVWPTQLCASQLISFAYCSRSMMDSNLESTLLKIIKASDANDMNDMNDEDNSDGVSASKEQLRKMLDDLKTGGTARRKASHQEGGKKTKGFGRQM